MGKLPFVFGCDAHVAEPPNLYVDNMPGDLKQYAPNAETDGNTRITKIGDKVIMKIQADFFVHKVGIIKTAEDEGVELKRRGARDLELRLEDMKRDGVDAELVFPSLGLMIPHIGDVEAERVACEIYNNWLWEYTAPVRQVLIAAAMIPCDDFDDALAEAQRTIEMGFPAICLWEGMGNYNDARWDSIFALAAASEVPIVFHTATGHVSTRALRGAGGAISNYTRQMNDAIEVITQLVAGGVLDRNPEAHITFAEHGAGWLWALGERMDEAYEGHRPYVEPKLSRMPSRIVADQVHSAMQNDVGSVATRKGVGVGALLFATDYPHSEGTFPFSRSVIERMMTENSDARMEDFVAILGGNAARLFKRAGVEEKVEERRRELVAARATIPPRR